MNVEELRFIVRQQRESPFFSVFDEYWVTNEVLAQALTEIDAVYRDRLEALRGINRKDYAQLALPKIAGGFMKPGSSNTCYGARRALWNLRKVLRRPEKQAKQEKQERPGEMADRICPILMAGTMISNIYAIRAKGMAKDTHLYYESVRCMQEKCEWFLNGCPAYKGDNQYAKNR